MTLSPPLCNIDFYWATFWVQVHNLPLDRMFEENAQTIGNKLSQLVEIKYPSKGNLCWNSFLRLKVQFDTHEPFLCSFYLECNPNPDIWISFKYEKLQGFCYGCGRLGHPKSYYSAPISIKDPSHEYHLGPGGFGPWMKANVSSHCSLTWLEFLKEEATEANLAHQSSVPIPKVSFNPLTPLSDTATTIAHPSVPKLCPTKYPFTNTSPPTPNTSITPIDPQSISPPSHSESNQTPPTSCLIPHFSSLNQSLSLKPTSSLNSSLGPSTLLENLFTPLPLGPSEPNPFQTWLSSPQAQARIIQWVTYVNLAEKPFNITPSLLQVKENPPHPQHTLSTFVPDLSSLDLQVPMEYSITSKRKLLPSPNTSIHKKSKPNLILSPHLLRISDLCPSFHPRTIISIKKTKN